jgi:hypothetical protein
VPSRSAAGKLAPISDKFIHGARAGLARNHITHEEMDLLKENNRDVLQFVNEYVGDAFALKFKSDAIRTVAKHASGSGEEMPNDVVSTLLDYIVESIAQRGVNSAKDDDVLADEETAIDE